MNEKSFSVLKKPQLPLLHIFPFLLITFFSETQSILWNSTNCEPQHCGNNKDLVIQYPFWIPGRQESYCGSPQFITTCIDNYPIMKFSGDDYIILNVSYTENSVVLARPEVFDQNNNCPVPQKNFSVEGTPFSYGPSTADLYFFYNCSNPYRDNNYPIQCPSNYSDHAYSFAVFHTKTLNESNESCQAPVNSPVSANNLNELSYQNYTQVLKMGFLLKWDGDDCRNCSTRENHCGSDNGSFICFCKDNVGRKSCGGGGSNLGWKNVIGKIWRWMLVSLAIVPVFVFAYVRIKRRIVKGKENRRRDDIIQQLTGSNSFNYGDELERGIKDAPDVKIFSLKAILASTNNFSDKNKLGQGGYGPVYKGKLSDGREIAVKRLSKTSGQGFLEFKSELILISKLQHTNLVRLYGCCIHKEEKMLIYEFMPNKSLDFFLFAQDKKEKIGWQIRFNIIEGVAQGLLYLHKYSRMKVIHRDLKVGNVLLDENMNPKIADFGMARIFQQNVTEAVTNRVVGTYGYMAPEYAMEGTFSIKSDVFSFGVLVLEIVSGRRNSSFYNPNRPLNLVGYAWELWKGHASLELKDETLVESFDVKQLLRVIHIGLLCVQENVDDRPTMSDVAYILKNENTDLPSPKKPAFFIGRQTDAFHLNETNSTDHLLERPILISENSLTVTTMEAR